MSQPISQKYRLELRPLDYYFFGGETTFGNGEGQNYYARTRSWPQQTSMLGVLRYFLYPDHCGPNSFHLENQSPYGSIIDLSPLFFTHRSENKYTDYFLSPIGKKGKPRSLRKEPGIESQQAQYSAEGIGDKEAPEQCLIDKKGNQLAISSDTIGSDALCRFFDKIGITKGKNGEDKTDAFYKQRMGKLADGFAFASIVNLASHLPEELFDAKGEAHKIVHFGAEKALFELSLRPTEKTFNEIYPVDLCTHDYADARTCHLLTSDTYITDDKLPEKLDFIIADTRSFRYISTPGKDSNVNFARLDLQNKNSKTALHKSGKYFLLQAGSLLYGSTKAIQNAVSQPAFEQIGYNHFIQLKNIHV
ncbi:MAG: type III-B CRISPR module-associated Cmr3 family protein [Bacteroidota bacterium]